ncbi:hypothetical protein CVT23_15610 [Minwuia thermotolerans]|uniref:HTH tetR-type domain-containing protein n=1 Tax=Minwuia thermotolerans TaxID=2056226 RepID=A0A2M9FZ80_9PROT|nr:hypothetical protein CVT23_15610 [Minwuia thermotolerans]
MTGSGRLDTRERLLLTAEKLFGQRGVNGVSLREIVRAAGQRNASALHYHFGSREGLIDAIFDKRMRAIEKRRMEMLDRIEAENRTDDLRAIAEAIVWPLAEVMAREEEGANYVRFLTEMFLTPDFDIAKMVEGRLNHGVGRAFRMIEKNLGEMPAAILRQRLPLIMHAGSYAIADIHATRQRHQTAGRELDLDQAINNLVDMWVGAVSAPVSEETLESLQKKEAARRTAAA